MIDLVEGEHYIFHETNHSFVGTLVKSTRDSLSVADWFSFNQHSWWRASSSTTETATVSFIYVKRIEPLSRVERDRLFLLIRSTKKRTYQ